MPASSSTTRIFCFPETTECAFISGFLSFSDWQQKRKCAAFSDFAFDPDLSTVQFHQTPDDGQPQSHAVGLLRLKTEKFIEDFEVVFRRNAGPFVAYRDFDRVVPEWPVALTTFIGERCALAHTSPLPQMRLGFDQDAACGVRKFQRILQQIGNNVLKFKRIEEHAR